MASSTHRKTIICIPSKNYISPDTFVLCKTGDVEEDSLNCGFNDEPIQPKIPELNEDGKVLKIYTLSSVKKIITDWLKTKEFVYYLAEHPADDDVNQTHFHIVIDWAAPTLWKTIKQHFPVGNIEAARKFNASVQYLVHLNDNTKRSFDWDIVDTNDPAGLDRFKLQTRQQNELKIEQVIELIDQGIITPWNKCEDGKLTNTFYSKNKTVIENAFKFHTERIVMDKDRNVKVIFLTGKTGTGKTHFAKRYATGLYGVNSFCITSSSNDPLQDYKGEPVLIMDDMRDDAFKFQDLLKLWDNHTRSSGKARYKNPDFIGNLIIITSTKDLNEWYKFSRNSEDLAQLKRRVTTLMQFTLETIYVNTFDPALLKYVPSCQIENPILTEFPNCQKMETHKLEDDLKTLGLKVSPSTGKYPYPEDNNPGSMNKWRCEAVHEHDKEK